MPLPLWALMGYGSYRAWRTANIVKKVVDITKRVTTTIPKKLPYQQARGMKDAEKIAKQAKKDTAELKKMGESIKKRLPNGNK